jgi:glutamyl-tRNA reductase
LSHKTAGIDIRERASLAPDMVAGKLKALVSEPGIAEALLLSTCNRSELYVVLDGCSEVARADVFARLHDCPRDLLDGHLYVLDDLDVVRHVFRVAAGVDSMVFGETEIVGQLKQSIEGARDAGTASRVLLRLGDRALAVGKRIRTETSVDKGCMSVASVAVDLAKQVFDNLARARILLLGAGETGELVAQRMVENGATHFVVASRTASRAAELAERFGAEAVGFDDFPEALKRSDIVISCTSSPRPLITVDCVKAAAAGHRHGPLFLVDLAVPRDIEPAVQQLNDVYLYDLDDLEELARECEEQRRCEMPRVDAIVDEEARSFLKWTTSLKAIPLMVAIRDKAEAIRDDEVARLLEAFPDLSPRQKKALQLATKRIVHRILDDPINGLRSLAGNGDAEESLEIAQQLFRIDTCPLPGQDESRGEGEDDHE